MKVLISAYACEPGKGSEPEVGWRGSLAISTFSEASVLTRSNNRKAIEEQNSASSAPRFIYFDLSNACLKIKRLIHSVLGYYCLWQASASWKLRHQTQEFDIIHHLTFNAFQVPGFWWFSRPAVVLGPLGGGQICPWRLLPLFRGGALRELLRSALVILCTLNPFLWTSMIFARVILVANQDTLTRIPSIMHKKVLCQLETAI
ncbi:MAG TPA: hypothetical protein PLS03_01085, partial [Terrimicrobiaceae bacterium]|nr:hypothetical protein [Terrimicrobiaceae bacterium]